VWHGSLHEGSGSMSTGSGAFEGGYSFGSRFQEAAGTNPEELVGAAHAGCFSMALAAGLSRAGFKPERIDTRANVHLEKVGEGFQITRIELDTAGTVPGIDEATFRKHAQDAKANCPVSNLYKGAEIALNARLQG
ncbi:MAG: OsmC family peroxiredoxin, partial [Gemmatimonadetes bacterium]|nr:OsmC family peroxiredoxin [Gemmatimonadota bacterium]